jgi:hypothetical protein
MKPTKKGAKRPTDARDRVGDEELIEPTHMYAIRFPNDEANVRAIEVWRNILLPMYIDENGIHAVYGAHVEALKRAGIPFENLSPPPKKNGKKKATEATPLPPERP